MERQKNGLRFELSVSKGWIARRLDVAFDRDYYFDPAQRDAVDRECQALIDAELGDLDACFTEANLGRKRFIEENQVLVGGIQPNMILGMLLGAAFVPANTMDADIENNVLAQASFESLPEPRTLLDHPIVREFDEQIAGVRREGRLRPIPPFFWDPSGRAAIHGTMTTALKFFGERLFLDMAMNPEAAGAVLDWVAECFLVLVRHYAEAADFEFTEIHVGECSGCMIGEEQFARFVVPGLNRLAAELGPLRLHSCGKSDHLLGAFKHVSRLSLLDLGGETSIAAVRQTFGVDFPISVAPPVEILAQSDPTPLLDWAKTAAADSAGGPLTIVCHLEAEYNVDAIRALARFVGE